MVTSGRMPIDCICHHPCIEMAYLEQGSGEVLVLIHGLGADAASWDRQMEALAQNYRVVAMDLRGHGRSGFRGEEPVTLRALAADVMALLQGRGIEAAHFCGSSMGGMIALEIFVRHGPAVRSLILSGTAAFFPPPQPLPEFLRHFDGLEMSQWGALMAERILRRGAPAAMRQEVARLLGANQRSGYRQGLVASFAGDYRWLLPLIDVPTLILVGEEDQATPYGYARYLHQQIHGSGLQVISQAAHFSHLENPGEFNWRVAAHLKSCGSQTKV